MMMANYYSYAMQLSIIPKTIPSVNTLCNTCR